MILIGVENMSLMFFQKIVFSFKRNVEKGMRRKRKIVFGNEMKS